ARRRRGRPGGARAGARQQGFRRRACPSHPASPPRPAASGELHPGPFGWSFSMPTDQDLFAEEQTMTTMSFGEHIEELRVRLILGLLGLVAGVIVVFLPPLDIASRVMRSMEAPAKEALDAFYRQQYDEKVKN